MAGITLFQTDLFRPRYQPFRGERWQMRITPMAISPGYWSKALLVQEMAVLTRLEDDGTTRTWMSMTPMEIESQEIGVRFATGHTVVAGMGMGWAAVNAALRPEVTRVTVVELDAEVIALNEATDVFRQLPQDAARKIEVVHGSALDYRTDQPVDTLMADIWLPVNGDDRMDQTRIMAENTGARRVYVWGQELVIARRARALGLDPLDAAGVARIVAETGLPLIGPELSNYPELITMAAAKWLRDA